jgi:hypothetical protein
MPRPEQTVEIVYARLSELRMRRIDDYPGHVQTRFTVGCQDCPREWETKYALLCAPARKRGCRACSYLERNADLAVPVDVAEAELRAAGREPLKPFPGLKKRWTSRCLQCKSVASPVLNNIRSRGTSSCDVCAKRLRGKKRRLPELEALRVMHAGGVEPAGPYPGSDVPWPSVCLAEGTR